MRKSEFYYRKYGTSEFIKSDAERKILVVAPKDRYHAEPLLWDADATPPEWRALSSFDGESVTTKGGEKIAGITVEYFETEEIAERTRTGGAAFLSAFRRLCKTSDADDDVKSVEGIASTAGDFTAENFDELLTLQKKNRWDAYYAARKTDGNGFARKNFACVFETDFDKLTLKFSCLSMNSASAKKYAAAEWLFDMENGLVASPHAPKGAKGGSAPNASQLYSSFCNNFNKENFPSVITERIFDILKDLACRFTGKKLSFPPFQKLAEDGTVWSWYLSDMVYVPFCPNLAYVLLGGLSGSDVVERFPLDRKDGDVLNKFLAVAGIPNLKSIRKAFADNANVIDVAYRLKKVGFTDSNCFTLAVRNSEFVDMIVVNSYPFESHLTFFLKYAFTKRSQIATMRTLQKLGTEDDEWGIIYYDALRMFHMYFDVMPESLKKAILRHGFNRKNHDELSVLPWESDNRPFTYTDEQRTLEDKIGGYEFCLPADTKQLVEIGREMHNCVGSYSGDVLRGNCTIVCAKKDGKYALCIEVRGNKVRQELADHNREPDDEQDDTLTLWRRKHGLRFF